ncbi:hypothetical protein CDD83_2604 [Cordyceps sp. RAO-2017]|nr:hypothetical protein CDD83_2604 [Cordyceps sp. RAO-2017]
MRRAPWGGEYVRLPCFRRLEPCSLIEAAKKQGTDDSRLVWLDGGCQPRSGGAASSLATLRESVAQSRLSASREPEVRISVPHDLDDLQTVRTQDRMKATGKALFGQQTAVARSLDRPLARTAGPVPSAPVSGPALQHISPANRSPLSSTARQRRPVRIPAWPRGLDGPGPTQMAPSLTFFQPFSLFLFFSQSWQVLADGRTASEPTSLLLKPSASTRKTKGSTQSREKVAWPATSDQGRKAKKSLSRKETARVSLSRLDGLISRRIARPPPRPVPRSEHLTRDSAPFSFIPLAIGCEHGP